MAGPPLKPTILDVTVYGFNTIGVNFQSGSSNGATIDARQIGYGLWRAAPQRYIYSDTSDTIGGLQPGSRYTFWARCHNRYGWGPLSTPVSASTWPYNSVHYEGAWRFAIPYVKVNGVWKQARPFVRKNGVWEEAN